MQFVNLTAHSVSLLNGQEPIEFPPSGTIIRLKEKVLETNIENQVKIKTVIYEADGADSWPQPRIGVLFIVSYMVAKAAPHRSDFIFPFDLVRKPGGVIVGCRSFARIQHEP